MLNHLTHILMVQMRLHAIFSTLFVVKLFQENKKIVCDNTTIEILWKGNPISCLKNVGKTRCGLCMKERRAILTAWRVNKPNFLNTKNEIFVACLCKSRFFQFTEE